MKNTSQRGLIALSSVVFLLLLFVALWPDSRDRNAANPSPQPEASPIPKAAGLRTKENVKDVDVRRQQPNATPQLAGGSEGRDEALERLKSRVRGVKVDFDEVVGSPAFIASTESFLAVPAERITEFAADDAHRVVKGFLNEYAALFGHNAAALGEARVNRDYVTAHNKMRTTVWQQEVDGIKVFEAVLQAHVTERGELVNVASHFVPAPRDAAKRVRPKMQAAEAVRAAAKSVGDEVDVAAVEVKSDAEGAARRQQFAAAGLTDVTAELVWLPENASAMSLCWQVIFMSKSRNEMFLTLVDTQSGEAVLRHGLTAAISPASYRVFTSDSPTPMSPGHATPLTTQPAQVARTLVTLDALDTTASPNGWINDGIVETIGNNVDAHLDVNADNVADTPRPQSTGAGRVFDPALNLTQAPSTYGAAAVVDLFYWNNVIHDRFYQLGFTEAAGNFQTNNFGRGGVGNDAVQADAQDGSGTNNANFSTPPDGSAGRMQMYVFTGPTPDTDGDFDHEVVIHEYTHGLSNRLVGGGVGMSASQSTGMGEGWSDFYGLSLLSEAADDVNGNYAAGGYASYQLSGLTSNYYSGIRRYPYTTNLLKNPLTFKDIDPSQASAHTGIPLSPLFSSSNSSPAEVHGQGEVWCVALWEARAAMVTKHGFTIGNELMLRLTTDGMKLAPANPTFLQARDGIIQADMVLNSGANRPQLWAAFAKRGMGANATSPASSTTTGVVENYDIPDSLGVSPTSVFVAASTVGSAPSPSSRAYTLVNSGTATLSWTAAESATWLDLSTTSGTLAAGATTTVTATINASASSLLAGTYSTAITFTNVTSAVSQQRTATLTVEPLTLPIFSETWETGAIGSAWTITGTNTHRTLVTTANGPYAGSYHLTMDSSLDNNYSRNEATLSVNLAGRSHVFLRFWVRHFSDEPDGPPTSPFTTGADFDGVAISANGTTWYEVQPLRALSGAWEKYTVDLDAAIAARGLAYNSTFKIRFNHYDNYTIPTDGFAFDNIDVYEAINNSVALSLPSSALENVGTVNGTLSLIPTPTSSVSVNLSSSAPGLVVVPPTVTVPSGQSTFSFPISITDDMLLNGSRIATVTPTVAAFANIPATIVVNDNETAVLSLSLPANATEGTAEISGSISVSSPVDTAVEVSLSASDGTEVTVPAKVTILAGQTSAVFPVTVLDDNRIDGTVNTTVSASVTGWTAGSATIAVADNEALNLAVTLPTVLREGDTGKSGTVSISGTLTAPLTVSLSSSDTTALMVPATVTILAGQKTVSFALGVVDDILLDGAQTASVTASAVGFLDGSSSGSVADNDAHHFTIGAIASPQIPNVNFPLTVTAKDVNDVVITNFNSSVSLSAVGAGGAVAMTPTALTVWVNGVASVSAKVLTFGTSIVITAGDTGGHTGASNLFDAAAGPLHHFDWSGIPTQQYVDAPFPATIRAVDVAGNTVPSYAGTASLVAISTGGTKDVGTGTATNSLPFYAAYHDTRTQSIYLASELGGAATWQSIALNIGGTSATTFQNFTVRIKTTSLASFASASFDASGWTEVYRANVTPSVTGWLTLPLTTPFLYDGTSNIMVDLSFDNSATGAYAAAFYTSATTNRSVYGYVNSTLGDPRTWSGAVAGATIWTGYPNLRFSPAGATLPVSPTSVGAFAGGVWSGNITVPFTSAAVKLRSSDGALSTDSNTFAVSPAVTPSSLATVFSEDFESGVFGSWWTITGTGNYRSQITTYFPRGGLKHLAMDEALDSGSYARNEATLTVNLAGKTGVVLKFWAAQFGDEAEGPPPSPFPSTGANFDGVAISADGGANWYEVQPLRTLLTTYTQLTVDLDAALAARGLVYSSNFKVRFNQYDNYSLGTDGIGIDDILITANVPPSQLTVTLPAQVTEGSGTATGNVSIPAALAADLVVTLTSKSPAKIAVPAPTTILAGQTTASFAMTVLDDSFVDGPKNVVITGVASGYLEAGAITQVIDNDGGTLTVTLPATVQENAGSISGSVVLSVPSLVPLSVAILSSNPLTAQPVASVVVPQGATNVNFNVAIFDNLLIDGTKTIQITASLPGWTPGMTTVTVLDNESANIALTVPLILREGMAAVTGTVTISGTLATNLTVTLNSSDTTEITLPTSVAIPAGQSSATFAISVVDDTETDGPQNVTITASSAGFSGANTVRTVGDNDAHHLTIAPIGSPQIKNAPIAVAITARDAGGLIIADYTGTVNLSAAGSGGALAVSPSAVTGFVNGAKTVFVQIDALDTAIVLTATDLGGRTGTSNPFELVVGNISAFAWDAIPSPQTVDSSFAVRLRAVDSGGNTATGFNGAASLGVLASGAGATIGVGNGSSASTFYNSSSDFRSNVLYTATEIGSAGLLRGVAFNFTSGTATLTNLTIRLKHTSATSLLTASSWDNTGWTQVYRSSPVISAAGWKTFDFTTPFGYDGTSNLLVDISADRATAPGTSLFILRTSMTAVQTIYGFSDNVYGDPLTWTSNPSRNSSFSRADARFSRSAEYALRPALAGNFVNGVWDGQVSIPITGSALSLRASAGSLLGNSNSFDVVAAPVSPGGGGSVLTIPAQATEGTAGVAGTITLPAALGSDTTIGLTSSASAKAAVPATVVIVAGQTSASFPISLPDDDLLDGPRSIYITATIPGSAPVASSMVVLDDDVGTITVTVPPSVLEGATGVIGTVSVSPVPSGSVSISLSSSDASNLTVPASVTILAGQASGTFPLGIVNNSRIDGNRSATITASVSGWIPATAVAQITDDETRTLVLSGSYGVFGAFEGLSSEGTVSIPGTLPTDLVVTLTSSNPSQFTVPANVTIPAGQTSATVVGTSVNDTATDGVQYATITASAATFTGATAVAEAYDDDVHHFTFSYIDSPRTAGIAFWLYVTADDVNGSPISVFNGTVSFGANSGGTSLAMTPAAPVVFANGEWYGDVTVNSLAANAVLTASDGAGHSGTSNSFTVSAGAVNRFVWGTIPSPVTSGTPVAATLTAKDLVGNTVSSFNGVANLAVGTAQRTVGAGTTASGLPFATDYSESRSQMIYLVSELGGVGRLKGLAFDVLSAPTVATRFTIRMKHTTLSSYTTYAWETTGWTTVFQGDVTPGPNGLMQINFTTPFDYNGTSNLMIDCSFDGAVYGTSGTVKSYSATGRDMYYFTDGGTDPLTWVSTSPYVTASVLPNLKLRTERTITISPITATFSNGVWSGNLSIGAPGTNLTLTADTATGLTGESNSFSALAAASLSVTPASSVGATGFRGGPFSPAAYTFTVANGGSGPMAWTVSKSAPWIDLSSSGGTLAGGGTATVTATLNASANALATGVFSNVITFTNTTNTIGNTTRTISLTTTAHGQLSVSETSLGNYTLSNTGDAALNWTLGGTPDWITSSISSGNLAVSASINATVSLGAVAATLPMGHYGSPLIFTNTSTGHGNTTLAYAYNVLPSPPTMIAEPALTGGTSNNVQWTSPQGISKFEAHASSTSDFATASSSGLLTTVNHTFPSLVDGQTYSYRARSGANLSTYGASGQSTTTALASGTASSVVVDSQGAILLSTVGAPIAGRITNGSFESEASGDTGTITGWSRNNALNTKRGALTQGTVYTTATPMPTLGANYVILYTISNASHVAGDYVSVSQSVDFTGGGALQFDQRNAFFTGYSWLNTVRAEVRIDGVTVWNSAAGTASLNQSIDVRAYSGTHLIELREQVVTPFNSPAAQWVLFDNIRLTQATAFSLSGTLISTAMTAPATGWGHLVFNGDAPTGTMLKVDVLNSANTLLAADLPSGTNLGAIPALNGVTSVKLRANFATTNTAVTPRLRSWIVTWPTSTDSAPTFGPWSNVVSSTQDASGPVVTITSPTTTSRSRYAITGTAADISGVAALHINGAPSSTPAAFSSALHLFTGVNTTTIVATDGITPANTSTTNVQITFTPDATDMDGDGMPDAWETAHGLSTTDDGFGSATEGPNGDLDRDGIPNFMEYALGLDPSAPSTNELPTCAIRINPADGGKYMEFTYRRRVGSAIAYTIQTSSTIGAWSTASSEQVGLPAPNGDGETETVTARILPAITEPSTAGIFARLHVGLP